MDEPVTQSAPSPVITRATGWRLFGQQFKALLWKNVLLSWRNYTATILQLLSSLFFIFLIFCVDEAIQARNKTKTAFKDVRDPEGFLVTAIPACEDGFYINLPCYDFLYSPNNDSVANSIVAAIKRNNPGRPIPDDKVLGFPSQSAADAWLLANQQMTTGALHFQQTPVGIGYGLQTNSTTKSIRGDFEDPTFKYMLPLQLAVEREIVRFTTGQSAIDWYVWFTEFAHPATTTFSTVGTIGPTFLLAAAMFGFVIQIGAVVAEREMKLRQAMDTMGLKTSIFWLTWVVWEVVLVVISSLLIVIFGMIFQFDFFLNNDFAVLFILFFLFELAMAGVAFMLSTFLTSSGAATTLGFFVFIVGFITQLVTVFGFPYTDTFDKGYRYVWALFPPNLLAAGLNYLGEATATADSPGIKWSQIQSHCGEGSINGGCVFALVSIYRWLFVLFFLYFLLAVYFDQVFPDVNGVRRPWLFFLTPGYWRGEGEMAAGSASCCTCIGKVPPPPSPLAAEDEDVVNERTKVQGEVAGGSLSSSSLAVQLRGLVKTFPGMTEFQCGCLCKCKKSAPFHAVKGSWFDIEKDKLFCLLGPNGAGKTTTINMLTGVLPVTDGDALIYGNSIKNGGAMSRIKTFMGVCPQFDILWGELSGREHLWLFANIRGLPKQEIDREVEELLAQVKLTSSQNMRSASYSGGMKRRLSVAVALIGDPKIVYLDEPTTGMDPVSRRHVWDIIEGAKKGRAIILTTHSMEEADILGDRIAIMAKGRLRCLGTSIHLKTKFGAGYVMSVSTRTGASQANLQNGEPSDSKTARVKAFIKEGLGVDPADESKAYVRFLIPRSKEKILPDFFKNLKAHKADLGITDVQLSLTTLEEVFLNIAKQAELETAAAEGRFDSVLLPNGTNLQVPVGAQFVEVPNTVSEEAPHGLMVECFWQQDEDGNLRISGHSELRARPPPTPQSSFSQPQQSFESGRRFSFQKSSSSLGRVIDAQEVHGAPSAPIIPPNVLQ